MSLKFNLTVQESQDIALALIGRMQFLRDRLSDPISVERRSDFEGQEARLRVLFNRLLAERKEITNA
jgi:hypothetical protein